MNIAMVKLKLNCFLLRFTCFILNIGGRHVKECGDMLLRLIKSIVSGILHSEFVFSAVGDSVEFVCVLETNYTVSGFNWKFKGDSVSASETSDRLMQ